MRRPSSARSRSWGAPRLPWRRRGSSRTFATSAVVSRTPRRAAGRLARFRPGREGQLSSRLWPRGRDARVRRARACALAAATVGCRRQRHQICEPLARAARLVYHAYVEWRGLCERRTTWICGVALGGGIVASMCRSSWACGALPACNWSRLLWSSPKLFRGGHCVKSHGCAKVRAFSLSIKVSLSPLVRRAFPHRRIDSPGLGRLLPGVAVCYAPASASTGTNARQPTRQPVLCSATSASRRVIRHH